MAAHVMRRSRTGLVLAAMAAVAGCGDDASDGQAKGGSDRGSAVSEAEDGGPPLYGPDGKLLASNRKVAGLPLPRGLETKLETNRRHVYWTRVPLDKVQAYFGPRLMTGEVDRVGEGAVFRHAVPRDVKGGVVKLDVSILPGEGGTRVEVVELPPTPKDPPSLEQIRRRAAQRPRE